LSAASGLDEEVAGLLPGMDTVSIATAVSGVLSGDEDRAAKLAREVSKAYAAGRGPGGFRTDGGPISSLETEIRTRWPAIYENLLEAWEKGRRIRRPSDAKASEAGKPAYWNVEVHSVEFPLVLPRIAEVHCRRCKTAATGLIDPENAIYSVDGRGRPLRPWSLAREVANEPLKAAGCACLEPTEDHRDGEREIWVDDVRSSDYSRVTVGDIPRETSTVEGRDDVELLVHLVGPRAPVSIGRIQLYGRVIAHPRTRSLEIVATDYRELDLRPVAEKMTPALRKEFERIGSMPDSDWYKQIGPRAQGLELAKEAASLVAVSLSKIRLPTGQEERGMLNLLLVGDTTSGKGEVGCDLPEKLRVGGIIHGESASRTGVIYAVVQNANGRWSVKWGKLPRYHGQLIVINEAGKLPREEVGTYRSVRREQEVVVDKVASSGRPVAVREIATLNPDDRKLMADFVNPAEALLATIYRDPADLARTDLVVTFASGEVPFKAIAEGRASTRPIPEETFRRFVFWCWNVKADKIVWSPGTETLLASESIRIHDTYVVPRIPLVNNATRALVARVACAYAARSFSIDESGERLVVTEEHLHRAVRFLDGMYSRLGLGVLHSEAEDVRIDGPVALQVAFSIGEAGLRVLNQLADGEWRTAAEIAPRISPGTSLGHVWNQFATLTLNGLVETVRAKGARLSGRGAAFLRAIGRIGAITADLDLTESRESGATNSGKTGLQVTEGGGGVPDGREI
jgi:hypothetical protein